MAIRTHQLNFLEFIIRPSSLHLQDGAIFFFASLALYRGDFALFQNVSRSYTFNRDVTAGNLYISLVCIMISYERLR